MKTLKIIAAFACIAIGSTAFTSSAAAQQAPNADSFAPNKKYFEQEYNQRLLMDDNKAATRLWQKGQTLANCLVRSAGDEAGSYIGGAIVDDEKYGKLTEGLRQDHRSCMTEEASGVSPMIASAALAERVVMERRQTMVLGLGDASPSEAQAFIMSGGSDIDVDTIGRCVAVLAPRQAIAVLETGAGTDAELAALDTLYAAAPQCGLKERPADIPPIFQRAAAANGLYFWSARG